MLPLIRPFLGSCRRCRIEVTYRRETRQVALDLGINFRDKSLIIPIASQGLPKGKNVLHTIIAVQRFSHGVAAALTRGWHNRANSTGLRSTASVVSLK